MRLASLLKSCCTKKSLAQGMIVHTYMVTSCCEQSLLVENLLMHMYGSCGALEDAQSLFSSMNARNLFSFSIMMSAYAGHGQSMETKSLFQNMLAQGLMPDKVVFVTLLSACCDEGSLKTGQILHVQIMCHGLHMDVFVGASLISMYNKCGDPVMAKISFEDIMEQSTISWNALMASHVDHGQPETALDLFNQMKVEGFIPDRATYLTVLRRSSGLIEARVLHSCLLGSELELHIAMGTSFICIYGRCGSLRDALQVFDKLPEKNVISWNAYITACTHSNCDCAIQSLEQMRQQSVLPDAVSFLSVLTSCRTHAVSGEVKKLHVAIVNQVGYVIHLALAAALIKAYSECSSGQDARVLFNQQDEHNLVSWNTIIGSSVQHGEWDTSLQLFQQLHQECYLPDKVTYTTILSGCVTKTALTDGLRVHVHIGASALELDVVHAILNMYAKCGALELAWVQFHSISEQNVLAWNSMISALLELEEFNQLFHLAQQMLCYGTMHTKVTYATLFTACANMAILDEGGRLHSRISGSCVEVDTVVGNAIINMYGKNGGVRQAKLIFDRMEKHSLITWNAIIGTLLLDAYGEDAVFILKQMQQEGIDPDEVTYFNILSACSHGGFLEDGIKHFMFMYYVYDIVPCVEHFNCLISLLGRAGRLDEGEEIIHGMPNTAVASSWMVLLACCNIHLDGNRAKQIANIALQLEPNNAVMYVAVANTFAMAD